MKKRSVPRQILGMLKTHILASIIITVILVIILNGVGNSSVFANIISYVVAAYYALNIYFEAHSYATDDLRSYSPLNGYAAKGFVLSMGIAAAIILAWIFYRVSWIVAPITDGFVPSTVAANILYIVLTSPFMYFVNVQGGEADIIGQLAALFVPVLCAAWGYFDGYRKKDITGFISKFMYEKKKK